MLPRMSIVAVFSALMLLLSLDIQEGEARKQHFVLIHGLGHGAWCWYKVVALLKQQGHTVVALDLTSNGINKGVSPDEISSVAQYSHPLIQYLDAIHNETVTLVGHSMAGLSLSYAMELYSHKVSKAIFLAAFTPRNNQSFLSSAFPEVFPRLVTSEVASLKYGKGASEQPTSVSINLEYVKPYFSNQSPEEDVMLAQSLLTPTPYAVALETLTLSDEKYGKVRRFFIMTMKDNLFLPQHQEYTIAQNPPERVFRMDASDHSAFFSYPLQLCNLLIHIAML
eukprot:Gb_08121 [translate_table: standard]